MAIYDYFVRKLIKLLTFINDLLVSVFARNVLYLEFNTGKEEMGLTVKKTKKNLRLTDICGFLCFISFK